MLVLLAVLLTYAWYDGGTEPMRPISEPIDLPGEAK